MSSWHDFFPQFLPGLWVTLKLTFAGLFFGLPTGILLAVVTTSPVRLAKWAGIVVVELGRGSPGLIVLYLAYYGLPQAGLTLGAFTAATVAVSFTTGAYTSEIFRAGLIAVPRGQREASRALGLSPWKELRLVVLPQALRIVIPPIIGWAIILYQGTSLAYAISVPELLSRAYNAGSITFQFGSALALAGLMYAVVSLTATALAGWTRSRVATQG
ncbi:amino acid ABC transporter permease [Streptomyces sp. AK04-3B]|uniref:amino acid ABC transporter permease n=1 Tax=Streptomyces sp. AK04-3B TaxID=3028650 RepID=UPI0029A36821|nr:amino acid ABC transporter permease [Streptomyces sp. AK04-3B]MDX3800418.1 amino acid ABC transporter permease [Streptomyces sp. AK04-3B]